MSILSWIFGRNKNQDPPASYDFKAHEKSTTTNDEHGPKKEKYPSREFKTKVAGVSLKYRQACLKRLYKLDDDLFLMPVELEREPQNKHDQNAIKVIVNEYNERTEKEKNTHIGYIRANVASRLAKDMDFGKKVTAHIVEIIGGYEDAETLGVLIQVEIE